VHLPCYQRYQRYLPVAKGFAFLGGLGKKKIGGAGFLDRWH
jgi:hypothetical protein